LLPLPDNHRTATAVRLLIRPRQRFHEIRKAEFAGGNLSGDALEARDEFGLGHLAVEIDIERHRVREHIVHAGDRGSPVVLLESCDDAILVAVSSDKGARCAGLDFSLTDTAVEIAVKAGEQERAWLDNPDPFRSAEPASLRSDNAIDLVRGRGLVDLAFLDHRRRLLGGGHRGQNGKSPHKQRETQ